MNDFVVNMGAMPTPVAADKVKPPVMIQPKVWGVRALVVDCQLMDNQGNPFNNRKVMERYSNKAYNGFDGVLWLGKNPWVPSAKRRAEEGLQRFGGFPRVQYCVFDLILSNTIDLQYGRRLELLIQAVGQLPATANVQVCPTYMATDIEQVTQGASEFSQRGYGGTIIRNPMGDELYKLVDQVH